MMTKKNPKKVKAVYQGDAPRVYPGQGLVEPGDTVEVWDWEVDEFDFYKVPPKKKASKNTGGN